MSKAGLREHQRCEKVLSGLLHQAFFVAGKMTNELLQANKVC
jgi:hypothetical protein